MSANCRWLSFEKSTSFQFCSQSLLYVTEAYIFPLLFLNWSHENTVIFSSILGNCFLNNMNEAEYFDKSSRAHLWPGMICIYGKLLTSGYIFWIESMFCTMPISQKITHSWKTVTLMSRKLFTSYITTMQCYSSSFISVHELMFGDQWSPLSYAYYNTVQITICMLIFLSRLGGDLHHPLLVFVAMMIVYSPIIMSLMEWAMNVISCMILVLMNHSE